MGGRFGGIDIDILPKQSASTVIAQQGILGDHAAPQQSDDSPMLIKWDTLLIAVAVVGGSVLIENSHRIDTGSPDDEVTATAPAACTDTRVAVTTASGDQAADDGAQTAQDAASALPTCSEQ
jgi:hypothetical protein